MSKVILSPEAVRGFAFGTMFLSFFGTLWAGIGIGGLQGWGMRLLVPLSLLLGGMLFTGGIVLIKDSRRMSNLQAKENSEFRKRKNKWFGIIFGLEGVLIAAASVICSSTNHEDWFFPIMAWIVGLHFLPLARLFQIKLYNMTGLLLCLLATITPLTLPLRVTWGNQPMMLWWISVGFGSALVLWGSAAANWFTGYKLLQRASSGVEKT